jgi:hypothetical protein
MYSPYVGAIVDTAKILSSLHTAHFQYIPALALPTEDALNLRLNVPPSFRDPKSVVVIALPPVSAVKPPGLHPVDATGCSCAQKPNLALAAEGAPLVFSTQLAHDLKLHIETTTGPVDLPIKADPTQGGFVFDSSVPALPEGDLTGIVRGKWGFDEWEGPRFLLHSPAAGKWSLIPGDQSALVVGREDTLHFAGDSTLCIDRVEEQSAVGTPQKLVWKSPKPETLEVIMPMKEASPGLVTLQIWQFGQLKPDTLAVDAYAEAASLDRLTVSSGDSVAQLKGTRLDEVAKVTLDGVTWTPGKLSRVQESDLLQMNSSDSTAGLDPGQAYTAGVSLRDGRVFKVPVTVNTPRPQVVLLSKGAQDAAASPVRLGSLDDLPVDERLVFFLKSRVPSVFPRNEKVEVAAVDSSFHTVLSLADGNLMLEDANTAMGTVEPLTQFGSSAFGPLQVRVMSADGVTGDWMPLGTLVRMPGFKDLRCPHALAKPCTLTGSNLFLVASVGATPDFDNATDVPPDFTGTQLSVPHPVNGTLYLRLRDDPQTVQTLSLPVTAVALGAQKSPPAQQGPPASAPPLAPAATAAITPQSAPGAPPSAPGTSSKDGP